MSNNQTNWKDLRGFNVGDSHFKQEVSLYLNRLEEDELWAIAYFFEVPEINQSSVKNQDSLKQFCFEKITNKPSSAFNATKERNTAIIEMNFLKKISDNNALRASKILSPLIASLTQSNMQQAIEKTISSLSSSPNETKYFPEKLYGRKELIASLLIMATDSNLSLREIRKTDSLFTSDWLEVLNSDELGLTAATEETKTMLLEELNKHFKKNFTSSLAANNLSEALMMIDHHLSNDRVHRADFIRRVKVSLAQKKYRSKGASKQKNLSLHQDIIKKLAELSRKYEMSEAQVVSLIIDGERKSPTHLENFIRREKRIEESYRTPED